MPETLIWKILLVDDDEDDYLLTREMLAMAQGKEVQLTWASSFEAGSQALFSGDFDAVLIDYDLGEHTGMELIRRAAAQDYRPPLILITGRGGYEVDLEAIQAGATLYLTKAEVNPPLLDRSIRYAIEHRQADLALQAAHQELEMRVLERTRELAQANQELQSAKAGLESTVAERTAELRYANELLTNQMVELEMALNDSQHKGERITRLTRFYATLSQVNEAIVRTHDRDALYSRVCEIVSDGGFPLVWIGEVQGMQVVPVAACGPAAGYLKGVKIETRGPLGNGPTGQCIREDHPVVNEDFATNPATRPWRRAALQYGIHASAAFPLRCQGRAIGAFTIYAHKVGTFDAEMVSLLEQLSDDISYALDAIDQEQQRAQAEQELRRSEERYRLLSENAADVIWTMDPEVGRFTYVSPSVQKLRGFTAEEVMARPFQEALAPESYQMVAADIPERATRLLKGDESARSAVRRVLQTCKDGSTVPVEVATTFITDEQGRLTQILGVTRDIRQRLKIEEEQRTSEERYHSLFNGMTEGFALHEIICDAQGRPVDFRFLEINPAFERLTGLKREEVIGKTHNEVLPDDSPLWIETYGKVALNGEPVHFENYSPALKQHYEVYAYRPAPMQFAVLFMNVTERKQAGEALLASETRLRRFYESGLQGVIYWNMDGVITDANDKFLEMTGYTRQDLDAGHIDWAKMTPPEYQYLDERSMVELKTTGFNAAPFEKEFIRKDGSRFPVILAGAMLDEARFNGVAFVLDITERKQAEEALRRSQALLSAVVDQMPSGITVRDARSGDLVLSNARSQEILGRLAGTPEQFDQYRGFHTADQQPYRAEEWPLTRSLATGEVVNAEEVGCERSDGAPVILQISSAPVRDPQGQIVAGVSIFEDITERKQLNEKLRQSEQRYRSLFESMQEGFYLVRVLRDAAGQPCDMAYLEANPAFERIMGRTREDLIGRTGKELVPSLKQEWLDVFGRVEQTGEPAHHISFSEAFQQHFETFVFRPAEGQVAVLVNNITERKLAEEKLGQQNRLIELSYEPIFTWDVDGGITSWNQGCEQLYGYTRAEALGRNSHELLQTHPIPQETFIPVLLGQGSWSGELRHTTQDGRQVLVESRQQLIESGGRRLVLETNRDVTERKRIEEALREARERAEWLARFPEENPNPVLRVALDGRVLYSNPAASRLPGWQYTTGQAVTRAMLNRIQQAAGLGHEFEEDVQLKDKFYAVSFVPFLNEGYVNIYGRDIARRKQAEQALEAAHIETENEKRLLEAVMAALPVGVAITDVRGGNFFNNPAFEQVWGGMKQVASVGEYTAFQAWWADSGKPLAPEEWASAQAVACGEAVVGQVLEIQRFDGTHAFVINSASPVRDVKGEIVGSAVSIQDITALRRAEAALRQSEQRWATALASIGDAVVTTDKQSFITYLNPVAEKLSGWSSQEAAGKPMDQVFPLVNEDTHQPADNPVARVLHSGRIAGLANHTALIARDGQFVPIEDSAAPIVDSAGQTLGVVMVFHDVTEKRKKETTLRQTEGMIRDYAQKLERSNRELQEFAAIASHDLQEPLRKIKAFSDLLQTRLEGRLSDEEIDLLERMRGAAGRMHELIESLLMYARVTTKAQPFRRVDLRELASEVVAGFDLQIERSKGRVELGNLPQVVADPLQMRQLLQNLIGNALKFHRPGVPPVVQVSGRTAAADAAGEAAAIIEVRDNGIGFEMKYLERIFRPFERLHGRAEFEGTGMGLAICKKIVERHQGSIGADSVVGEGTTFIVTLPATQKQ